MPPAISYYEYATFLICVKYGDTFGKIQMFIEISEMLIIFTYGCSITQLIITY